MCVCNFLFFFLNLIIIFYVFDMMRMFIAVFRYVKSAQSLFTYAEEAYCSKDEERAYVLYMRYFNIIQLVKKSAEYKKNKVF